jgi:hypothetical protein
VNEKIDSVRESILLGLIMYFGSRSGVVLYKGNDSTEKNCDILVSVFLLNLIRNLQIADLGVGIKY